MSNVTDEQVASGSTGNAISPFAPKEERNKWKPTSPKQTPEVSPATKMLSQTSFFFSTAMVLLRQVY